MGNIVRAVHQAGYEVSSLSFTSAVSAQSTLSHDKVKQGCLLADIGATTTNILFFKDGTLRHLDILPIGGNHFTEKIAEALQISFDLAEDIKRSHATVLQEDVGEKEEVLVRKDESYVAV